MPFEKKKETAYYNKAKFKEHSNVKLIRIQKERKKSQRIAACKMHTRIEHVCYRVVNCIYDDAIFFSCAVSYNSSQQKKILEYVMTLKLHLHLV